ncbi:MAG: GNAT family N-acetyltransferase [Candidatus Omnitrophica bacterium]|nr:GNAT family N-acetyltransferase [Candidatus Omnitrophota bacterium]
MVRPFRFEDLPAVKGIANRAWKPIMEMFRQTYGEELFSLLRPHPETDKGEEVAAFCRKNPDCCLVCEENGQVVGFVTFWLDREKRIGEIGNNAADPECGIKGIGQQMYQAVFEVFRRAGMRYAVVHTGLDQAHSRARLAYQRAGFNIKHEEVTYFRKL